MNVTPRVSIFIDGNNMYYAQQKNGWFFDPRKILDYFKNQDEVLVNAFWYQGIEHPGDKRAFLDALINIGYTVRTKLTKQFVDQESGRTSQKANLDVEIVIDMFNTVDLYDHAILFSGDGDFERAVELLRSHKTRITVVATEGMVARELRNAADRYIDLNELKANIIKTDVYSKGEPVAPYVRLDNSSISYSSGYPSSRELKEM
jgi:uncharacterized LabA/DUF88 family protein